MSGITIDWAAFGVVFVVSLAAAVGIVVFYSLGLRLLAVGPGSRDGAESRGGERPPAATLGAGLCFAICVAAVLFGLWVLIPQFH